MNLLEQYCKRAMKTGIDGAKVIDPDSVVTAEWVRAKCQFGCPGFGKRLCCPPYTPTPDQTRKIMDQYQEAILLHQGIKDLESSAAKRKMFNETMVRLEIEIFLDGLYKSWSMGSGACRLCKECDPTGLCKHGFRARPPMEACGIDVFKTARDNGFPIEVVRTREGEMNVFGLILVG
jgi:predicted metal-binding protein